MSDPQGFSLKVIVTEDHIAQGKRADCLKCPVALAIKDALKDTDKADWRIGVGSYSIRLWEPKGKDKPFAYFSHTPITASDFILGFDSDKAPKPFSFEAHFSPNTGGWA